MNQEQFAKALGFSRNYISMIEGGRDPGPGFMSALLTFERAHALTPSEYEEPIVVREPTGGSAREKLQAVLVERRLTPQQLAKLIRYDAGIITHAVQSGRMSEKMAEAISRELPELSKEELLSGSDEPPVISEHGAGTHGAKPSITLPPGMKGRMVPLLSMAQAGGWDAGHSDEGWQGEAFFALNVEDRRAFAIRVSGNSMEPEIREGDVVVCSPSEPLTNGSCAVVRTKSEQAFIKFWRARGDVVTLESANPDYKPIQFPLAEIAGAWPVVQRIASGKITKA